MFCTNLQILARAALHVLTHSGRDADCWVPRDAALQLRCMAPDKRQHPLYGAKFSLDSFIISHSYSGIKNEANSSERAAAAITAQPVLSGVSTADCEIRMRPLHRTAVRRCCERQWER